MDLKKAREYYDLGVLTGFRITRETAGAGWVIIAQGKDDRSWLIEVSNPSNQGATKIYKSLDSAHAEIARICSTPPTSYRTMF